MARRDDALAQIEQETTTFVAQSTDLLTVREVANRLRVDDTTVRRWIKNGALEAITLPHQGKREVYRVKKDTLDTLLTSPAVAEV